MMPYKGYYWTILAPLMKKSITRRYSRELAQRSIKQGKLEYKKLLNHADDIGPGNPMAMNAYFAYVFAGAWLGSGKEITPDGMAEVMTDVLHNMKPMFSLVNLNRPAFRHYWDKSMRKYEKWSQDKFDKYPTTWKVNFDESLHQDGTYYYFTQCPVCTLCKKEGIPEIMAALCGTDWLMFKMQHGILHRACTLAGGDPVCDYWVVPDKIQNPR